jgi:hypothetical protein
VTDEYLEIAYWSVVKDLEAPVDIPVARLKAALPEFMASTGTPAKAGAVIYNCLSDVAWDWPAWNNFAKKVGYESLQNIASSITKMRPAEILKSLSVAELKLLCLERNVEQAPRAPKDGLVAALLKSTDKDAIPDMVLPFRQHLQKAQSEKCRKQMAFHMSSRILGVAHSMYRYAQLNDPDLLKICPFWRFVWGGVTDIDAPKSCRKFNNNKLPHNEAKQVFPILPCDYLKCGCYIVADSGRH